MKIQQKKRILVAPLNWGLGHATRCVPVLNTLITSGFEPIIASDGAALVLLKKEFPQLKAFELPSYNITYPKNAKHFKFHFLKALPHILKTIKREKNIIKKLVKAEKIDGIISDNRFGVWHAKIPSVYITHQVNALSGKTTWLSSKIHQRIIKKFDACWVPDFEGENNLSGNLGHPKTKLNNLKYINPVSRFEKQDIEISIDILVILSGPEPQRTKLEIKLLSELSNSKKRVVFVKGIVEKIQTKEKINGIEVYNFMTSKELEKTINTSELVISRSGYTTIMDLEKLGKKAIFIPTPGQFEQLYLAKRLSEKKIIPFFEQDNIISSDLKWDSNFSGFKPNELDVNYSDLFDLF